MEIRDFYTPPGEKKKVSPPKDFWSYAILGWAGCFVAAVFLFSKMFGSFVEPESSSAFAFYGFISLVPGVIIGLLVYNAKKSAYEQYLRECQQENNNTIHPSTDSIQPINSAEYTKACPYCGEQILKAAKKCKHCGEWIKDEDKIVEVKKMDCPICGEEIDASSTLCPICHEPVKQENKSPEPKNAFAEKMKAQPSKNGEQSNDW